MSAYALPGIFPPIVDNCSSSGGSSSQAIHGVPVNGGKTGEKAGNTPLHNQDSSRSISHRLLKSAVDRLCPSETLLYGPPSSSSNDTITTGPHVTTSVCHETAYHKEESQTDMETGSSSSSFSTMIIAVKEAKIDPVRLIQYLTGTTPQQTHRKTLRRRGSKERLSSSCASNMGGGAGALLNSPTHRKRSMVQPPALLSSSQGASTTAGETSQNGKKNTVTPTTSPHEEAIEFELSISFHGRKYTAKRTMQCIVQLRDDLIREMKHRKQWLTRQRGRSDDGSNSETRQKDGSGFDANNRHNQRTRTKASAGLDQQDYIPEIPPLASGEESGSFSGGTGFVGRGFTMLHAMVTSYVPVMERWLKNVLTIVPQDSECLMNFLWEPVEDATSLEDFATKMSCTSLATLGSIKELDYNTEDSDDDDDVYCELEWHRP